MLHILDLAFPFNIGSGSLYIRARLQDLEMAIPVVWSPGFFLTAAFYFSMNLLISRTNSSFRNFHG